MIKHINRENFKTEIDTIVLGCQENCSSKSRI